VSWVIGCIFAGLVGILLGLIGAGGATLLMPVMVYILDITPVNASRYSLFIVGITTGVGIIRQYRQIRWSIGFLFLIPAILTTLFIRNYLLPKLPKELPYIHISLNVFILVLLAVVMLLSAWSILANKKVVIEKTNPIATIRYAVGIGIVSGMTGAGGGFLATPALVKLGLTIHDAIATSLLVISANSFMGFMGDLFLYPVSADEWRLLLIFTGLATVGIFIGSALKHKTSTEALRKIFAAFLIVIAGYILLKELIINYL
jgi:uncharacterized membrane protein YfcA